MPGAVDPRPHFADDDSNDVTREFERVMWARQILAAIQSLPAAQSEVIQLSYFEHLSQADIAVKLGLPLPMVKTSAARALRHLAGLIEAPAGR